MVKGEKIRHQTNSVVQEEDPPLAPTFPTPNARGNFLNQDYFQPSNPFITPDTIGNFPVLAQSHDDYKDSDDLDVQHLLHSDYTGQTLLTQQPSPDWSGFSRPMAMTSQPVALDRHTLNTPFHNTNDLSSVATHASCCSTNLASDSGNTYPTSDPQYTIPGVQHSSKHTENILHRTNSHPDVNRQPQSRHQQSFTPTMMSTSSVDESAPLHPASRVNKSFQSPHERPQSPKPSHYRHHSGSQSVKPLAERPMPSSHAGLQHSLRDQTRDHSSSHGTSGSSTSIGDPASPLQRTHTHCSHCRCLAMSESPLALPNPIPPSTPAPTPTRPCSRASSSQNVDLLSECSSVLDHLAHAPDTNNHADNCQSSGGDRSRKIGQSHHTEHSPEKDRKSVNERYGGDRKRTKIVEKVVIVYMRGGDREDGGPEKVNKVDYRGGR